MSDEKENINYAEPNEDSTSIDENLKKQSDRFDNLPKTPSLLDRLSASAYRAALDTLGGLISAARDSKNKVDAFVKTQKEELSKIAGELAARSQSLDTREEELNKREEELNALEEKINESRKALNEYYQSQKSEMESQSESLGKREEDASSLMERATELEAAFRDKNGISPEIPQDYLLRDQKIIEYMKTLKAEADRIYALTTRKGVEETEEDKKVRTEHYEDLMASWIGACSNYRDSLSEQEAAMISVGGESLSMAMSKIAKEMFPGFSEISKREYSTGSSLQRARALVNSNIDFVYLRHNEERRMDRLARMASLGYSLGKDNGICRGVDVLFGAADMGRRFKKLDDGSRVLKDDDILKATGSEESITEVAQVINNIKDARETEHVEDETKDDDGSRE